MKKTALLLVLVLLLSVAFACTPKSVQSFTVEAGKAAFVQEENARPTRVTATVDLPAGKSFVADWGEAGVLVADVMDEETGAALYGVWRDGAYLLPCTFRRVDYAAPYYVAQYRDMESQGIEVYDRTGRMLVGSQDTSARVVVVSDEYFALYTTQNAQLFDAEGEAYFGEGIMQPTESVSACGQYVLTIDTALGSCRVWDGKNVLRRRFYEQDVRYVAAYIDGRFFVTALGKGTQNNYTYIEKTADETVYMRQRAWWYYPETDVLEPTTIDYVLLSVVNACTAGVDATSWRTYGLNEGYSAAVVAELDRDKVHAGERYYVLDKDARPVVRYPVDVNPTAIRFRDDVGFAGSSLVSGAAALYDLACNMLWQKNDRRYATMRWQWGRLVASYREDGRTLYGAFDAEGNVAVDFVYDYMSPYFGDRCAAKTDGRYVLLDGAGTPRTSIEIACPEHWLGYGVYAFRAGASVGVKNFAEETIVAAEWDALTAIGRNADGTLYIVARKGDTQRVLRIQ